MEQRVGRIDEALRRRTASVLPLSEEKNTRDDLPQIVNVVATVAIFPPDSKTTHRFPLEAIASQVSGNVQYGPLNLPANILRIRDSVSDSTALVFRSGKLVIVHCLSWEHSRFCCHYYRMLLEQIQCVMRDPEDGDRLTLTTLAGRTEFHNWEVHNSVGYGQLGCRVDLTALRDAAPHICQYKPDAFPGLMLRVWIKDPAQCECKGMKCPCKVQMLIFDTGKVVIVGARSIRDVNSVFYRFKAMVPQYRDYGKRLPRSQRFEARVARLLGEQKIGVPVESMQNIKGVTYGSAKKNKEKNKNKKRARDPEADETIPWTHELEDMTAIMDAIDKQSQRGTHLASSSSSAFLRACLEGQEQNVRWMLDMDYDAHVQETDTHTGKTALELLQEIPIEVRSTQHEAIIRMLQVKREKLIL